MSVKQYFLVNLVLMTKASLQRNLVYNFNYFLERFFEKLFVELKEIASKVNKTGLQPVSRPVEPIIGFFCKDLKKVQTSTNI